MACYLRYRKTRPELHAASTFKMPWRADGLCRYCILLIYFGDFGTRARYIKSGIRESTMVGGFKRNLFCVL